LAASPNDMMKSFPLNPHHEIRESFVDNVGSLFFDGQILRLEFAVARVNQLEPETKPTGERHVVARLALTLPCTIDLISQMRMLAESIS